MDSLFAKLTNLGYEFFGILMPGFVASVFLGLWVLALGSLVPVWTFDFVPELTIGMLKDLPDVSMHTTDILGIALLIMAWYFLGHFLKWISRSGGSSIDPESKWYKILGAFLRLHVPKPLLHYRESLSPHLIACARQLEADGVAFKGENGTCDWNGFFPIAKTILNQNLKTSMIATYQNKYTLHRSISAAAKVLFWLTAASLLLALVTWWKSGENYLPNCLFLLTLTAGALFTVWGFAKSYLYNWTLFGDFIITETYTLLCVKQPTEKSEGDGGKRGEKDE